MRAGRFTIFGPLMGESAMLRSCLVAVNGRRSHEQLRRRMRPAASIGFFSGALLACALAAGAERRADEAAALVDKGLAAEIAGNAEEREAALAAALELAPDYAPARWHKGFVGSEGKWAFYADAPADPAQADALEEYRKLRTTYGDDADSQLKLADWCHRRGLAEQERAHLLRSLDLAPQHTALRERLGWQQVDGVWRSPREVREAKARGKQALADLKRWSPRVEKLRDALDRPPGRQRDRALEQIRSLRDPSAILALETILAPANEDAALAVVDALAEMKAPEAALALARLAAFSASADVVDAAEAKLKSQPAYNFIPAMLSSLVAPGGIQTMAVASRSGGMTFRQTFILEGADRKSVAVFDNTYRPRSVDTIPVAAELGAALIANRTRAAEAQNRRFEQTNKQICKTLRAVTGLQLDDNPADWWKWWNDYNEVILQGEKDVSLRYYRQEVQTYGLTPPPLVRRPSCLVAGTPIWSDRGAVPVEQMQIGDRVLAQDPISGELAYKPVLRTTVRKKSSLVHITLGDETIVASGGHPFWVAGQGWVNARHLEAGMLLHGIDGAVPVESVKIDEEGDEPVYNLVVEDFHDYFAGKARLLLHDVAPREPTRGPLPGLEDRPPSNIENPQPKTTAAAKR